MTKSQFIEKSRNIHGYKYKYPSLKEKVTLKDKIEIILDNQLYVQSVSKHLMGKCPEKKIQIKTNQNFIEESKNIWGEKYNYSLVDYTGSLNEIKIILDGFIYSQRASSHLRGIAPEYRKSKDHLNLEISDEIGKKEIEDFLTKYKIKFEKNRRMSHYNFQFYLPEFRTIIEYQSNLHFRLENIIDWDNRKSEYCEENYINLIRIKFDQINIIWEILWTNLKSFIKSEK